MYVILRKCLMYTPFKCVHFKKERDKREWCDKYGKFEM